MCVGVCYGHHPQDGCLGTANKAENTALFFKSRIVFLFKGTNCCCQVVWPLTLVQHSELLRDLNSSCKSSWKGMNKDALTRRWASTAAVWTRETSSEVEDHRIRSTQEKMFLSLLFSGGKSGYISAVTVVPLPAPQVWSHYAALIQFCQVARGDLSQK